MIALLQQQLKQVTDQLEAAIAGDVQCARDAELLQTIPGVGPQVARLLLSTLPPLQSFRDAGQLAAYVGVAPVVQQSGRCLNYATTPRGGKPMLRAAIYFPTMSAIQYNPLVAATFHRLVANGKPKKVALIAAMHKLLRICYGVIKHQQPFNQNHINMT